MAGWPDAARDPLFQMGGGLLVFSVAFAVADRTPASVAFLAAGLLLVLLGRYGARVRKGKVGPTGLEFELDAEAREVITSIASAEKEAVDVGPDEEEDTARWVLAEFILNALLLSPAPPIEDCRFQVYLFDPAEHLLVPILEPEHPGQSPGFAVGQGTVGMAWATGVWAVARGRTVSDETFGLTDQQRERYADVAVAASVPIRNAAGRVIGVLSGFSRRPGTVLGLSEGFELQVFFADAAARVLVDLLKWFSDGYDQLGDREQVWTKTARSRRDG
jgi:hypothetical protein